jgi:hypothetical protein
LVEALTNPMVAALNAAARFCAEPFPLLELADGPLFPLLLLLQAEIIMVAAAVKPNLAFYEALGSEGMAALERIRAAIPSDLPVVADAKRADIGSTAARHAVALFDRLGLSVDDLASPSPVAIAYLEAPVFDPEGRTCYVLEVHVLRETVPRAELGAIVARVRSAADELTLECGGLGVHPPDEDEVAVELADLVVGDVERVVGMLDALPLGSEELDHVRLGVHRMDVLGHQDSSLGPRGVATYGCLLWLGASPVRTGSIPPCGRPGRRDPACQCDPALRWTGRASRR